MAAQSERALFPCRWPLGTLISGPCFLAGGPCCLRTAASGALRRAALHPIFLYALLFTLFHFLLPPLPFPPHLSRETLRNVSFRNVNVVAPPRKRYKLGLVTRVDGEVSLTRATGARGGVRGRAGELVGVLGHAGARVGARRHAGRVWACVRAPACARGAPEVRRGFASAAPRGQTTQWFMCAAARARLRGRAVGLTILWFVGAAACGGGPGFGRGRAAGQTILWFAAAAARRRAEGW